MSDKSIPSANEHMTNKRWPSGKRTLAFLDAPEKNMPMFHMFAAARHFVVFTRRWWYGSGLTGANRRGAPPVLRQFETQKELLMAIDSAIDTERASSMHKVANRSHWGKTGIVQMMYLGQASEVVRNILKGADQESPQSVDFLAIRLAEVLQHLESLARNDASDTDGFATGSIRRVRASLFAHPQPKTLWACTAWRKLASLY